MIRFSRLALMVLASAGGYASVTACGAFGADSTPGGGDTNDAQPSAADAGSSTATIRCGSIACGATQKCCLPADDSDAGCIDRGAICAAGLGELLCSSPTSCKSGDVCCVTAKRNAGQTGFDIDRAFCVAASACPDGNLQRSLCELGAADQCPGRACKPYLHDTNGPQDLEISPAGYATCQ